MMMKRKIIALLFAGVFVTSARAQITQVVDLSTGVYTGGATEPILVSGTVNTDDHWRLDNGGPQFIRLSKLTGTWVSAVTGQWISPFTSASGNALSNAPQGTFRYMLQFTAPSCTVVGDVTVNLASYAGDNTVTGLSLNTPLSGYHALSGSFSSFSSTSFTMPGSSIIPGAVNTVYITVLNNSSPTGGSTYSGLYVKGSLTINYAGDPSLVSHITGPTQICDGTPLTVNGSTSTGTAGDHVWIIAECDAMGNVAPGTPDWWSPFYPGNPGSFTFPSTAAGGPSLPCGKYYQVKLALQGPCDIWKESTCVVKINCKPTPTIEGNTEICEGSSTQLCCNYMPSSNATLSWNVPRNGSLQCVTVSPSVNTTYTVTVTNQYGCSASASATVNVFNLDPSVNLYANTTNSTHFELTATPNQTTGLPSVFGFVWIVEELDASLNTVYTVNSSNASLTPNGCWWTFPGGEVFDGFDGLTHTLNSACSPSVGKFKYNTNYRITRGVWSTGCPWEQNSYLISYARSENGVVISEDHNAPDYSYLMNQTQGTFAFDEALSHHINVYPNPSTGLFTIETAEASGKIQVFDMMGKNIRTIELNGSTQYTLDLSGSSKGIYTVNVITGNQNRSQKIVLE